MTDQFHIESPDTNLIRAMQIASARGQLRITPVNGTFARSQRRATPKHYNQAVKARKRQAQGKPSYRQRQASSRAAKAQRQSLAVPV